MVRNSMKSSARATCSNRALDWSALGPEELGPHLPADPVQLLGGGLADQVGGDRLALGQLDAVVDPLPDLGAGDLGGGRVLHQVEDRGRALAAQPRGDVLDADVDVAAQALLGGLAGGGRDVEQVALAGAAVVAPA